MIYKTPPLPTRIDAILYAIDILLALPAVLFIVSHDGGYFVSPIMNDICHHLPRELSLYNSVSPSAHLTKEVATSNVFCNSTSPSGPSFFKFGLTSTRSILTRHPVSATASAI